MYIYIYAVPLHMPKLFHLFMRFHACLPDPGWKTIPWQKPAPKCSTCEQKRRFSARPLGLGWSAECAKFEHKRFP